MIQRLQKLRSKRGFTMIELIIVVAIIAIMVTTVFISSNTRREKILEANSAASNFYSALQSEFTGLQMFDGPLTMTLDKEYNTNFPGFKDEAAYLGMKYYPFAGGNYPFDGEIADGETHRDGKPKTKYLYVEFYAFGGRLRRVNFANDISTLLTWEKGDGNESAELSVVLLQDMKERVEYKDGYYYALISYEVPTPPVEEATKVLNKYDYMNKPVKVEWTAYCANEVTDPDEAFQSQNYISSIGVCGVHATKDYTDLGTTGTTFVTAGSGGSPL